jgi:hypothetical protein
MNTEVERLLVKTPQQQFVQRLEQDYRMAPRVAQAILAEAQVMLSGTAEGLPPGQMRVLLSAAKRGAGQALRTSQMALVTWTVDAGAEDYAVQQQQGVQALRQVRIQRLLDEAIEQEAEASQEDLARALHVSVRTIKRDCAALEGQGKCLPTRGHMQGIGRGQTHKAQIVGRWLAGETYDQIAQHTRHSATSIQRYVQTFLRVVQLTQRGLSEAQVAQVVQIGPALLREYLTLYKAQDTPACRERLAEQVQRLERAENKPEKGAL